MGFVLFLHILVCILLVITVLMQAGRGGGLAESFSSAESVLGTQANAFMVRVSTVLAVIFVCTSLTLAISYSKRDRSLMSDPKMMPTAQQAAMEAQAKDPITVETAKPVEVQKVVEEQLPKTDVATDLPKAVETTNPTTP